ncbi:MAG: hypothetical protein WA172_14435 [Terriglobales bacterium]
MNLPCTLNGILRIVILSEAKDLGLLCSVILSGAGTETKWSSTGVEGPLLTSRIGHYTT